MPVLQQAAAAAAELCSKLYLEGHESDDWVKATQEPW